jgi:hypothetical protein
MKRIEKIQIQNLQENAEYLLLLIGINYIVASSILMFLSHNVAVNISFASIAYLIPTTCSKSSSKALARKFRKLKQLPSGMLAWGTK